MWAVYSLLSAFGISSSDAFAKKAMEHNVAGARILFVRYLLSVAVLLPFLGAGIPTLDRQFWLLHPVWLPLETVAIYLYIRAIRVSPLSLTLPFLALTPAFLVVTGWVFLGESLGLSGAFGILLVVVGSYVINLSHAGRDLFGPFRAMARESGTRLMVLVAFLYSLTSVLGKALIQHSSPTYFAVHYAVVMSVVLAPAGLRGIGGPRPGSRPTLVVFSGVLYSVMILFHMLALNTANVAYVIALKRFAGVFGVIYGRLFFSEKGVGYRLAGSVIMVAGGLLILLD